MKFDEAIARKAVDEADLNALRMALLQVTGDESLARMDVDDVLVRGGAAILKALNPRHHEEVKEKAIAFFRDGIDTYEARTPTEEELRRLLETMVNEEMDDLAFKYRRNILALDEFPREVAWSGERRPKAADEFFVVVIGAGFSGIAMGVQLERLGIPYRIFERRHEVGGVWSINTYPDARVDTTNFVYQYSFEKNYRWSQYFARQHEVRGYIESVARKWGVFDKTTLNADVQGGEFDAKSNTWCVRVKTPEGTETLTANLVVTAAGLFATPKRLDVPGIDSFEGVLAHTTEWTADQDVTGKRVAIIGNGSTGVQLLSRVASQAAHVDVYQRTAQWISPRERYGQPISPETRWLLDTMPFYPNWYTYSSAIVTFGSEALQVADPEWQAQGGLVSKRNDAFRESLTHYIKTKVGSRPELVEKLVPKHAPYARRLIVDNRWYETLLSPHVDLVTEGIDEVTPTSIKTVDGSEHPTDLIISATGFDIAKYLWPSEYHGLDGVNLNEAWEKEGGGPRAYLGMAVPAFPNFFMMYGPNSQNRSGQLIYFVETWAHYVAELAVMMIEDGIARCEIRRDVFEDYNVRLDQASEELLWTESASREQNYYVNEFGRQQTGAPWPVAHYFRMSADVNPDDYLLTFK
jgi:4-hydroxyacetophenone monooxygenase